MIFSAELLPLVLDGRKTETRRPVKPGKPTKYRVGKTYSVQPGRGMKAVGRIRVEHVAALPVRAISNESAIEEGFEDAAAYLAWWKARYGTTDGACWRIQFVLVHRNDR